MQTLIAALLVISFISICALTASHLIYGNTCPKLFGIPACYILIFFIAAALVSQFGVIADAGILFYIGAGFTFLVAVYASIGQLTNRLECPKLFGTIPMCYLSFLTFGAVLVLKLISAN